ncbi:hypothetical protein ABZ319_27845 [Nocardia sp. NPDC005978]|uniref:hypothetical protein n=1 Tax=Nocardia sp. NPDC005978 TaxID=3156725 RepID=UPI0033A456E9
MGAIALGLIALLLFVGSFLRLVTTHHGSSGYRGWATPWGHGADGNDSDFTSWFGVLFVVPALLAAIAALLLLLGGGARPRIRAFASLATGSALGTAIAVLVRFGIAPHTRYNHDVEYSYGGAFWVCALILPLAVLVFATAVSERTTGFTVALDAYGRPQRERATGLDVTSGVLLVLYALLAVGGSVVLVYRTVGVRFVMYDHYAEAALLTSSAVAAFVGGLLMFLAGRASARRIGAAVSALVFSAGASVVLADVDMIRALEGFLEGLNFSFYMFLVAILFALIAMVLTVLAAGSAPRYRTPYPPTPAAIRR